MLASVVIIGLVCGVVNFLRNDIDDDKGAGQLKIVSAPSSIPLTDPFPRGEPVRRADYASHSITYASALRNAQIGRTIQLPEIRFEESSDELTLGGASAISDLAIALNAEPTIGATVIVRSDPNGGTELADRRSAKLLEALQARGVAVDRLNSRPAESGEWITSAGLTIVTR